METVSPARTRADRYAAMAPEGAAVTITEDEWELLGSTRYTAQVTVKGSIETILITIGSKAAGRSRVSASRWFNSGGGQWPIQVGHLAYTVRNLYVGKAARS